MSLIKNHGFHLFPKTLKRAGVYRGFAWLWWVWVVRMVETEGGDE